MPARAARALTESSRPLDRRILTRSVLGLNSKRTGTIPDKSYSERSAVATKCSASSSVFRTGSFFNFLFLLFIVLDFLSVHIACTNRPNEDGTAAPAKRKRHKNVPSGGTPPNGLEALLHLRMLKIWEQRYRSSKNRLDFSDRNAMALALVPIAMVPVKPGRGKVHDLVYDCTYKCQSYSARLASPPRLQRRPQAAIQPKAVDWRRRVDGADARQPHAGPLEAAFLQHPARGRIVDARAGYQRFMLEVAERVVDQGARGFGGKTAAPIGHAEPVAELGPVFTQVDAAHADRPAVERDGEACLALALVDGGDELLGVLDRVGMRNARGVRRDAAVVDECRNRFDVAATRGAQHEPCGGENRKDLVSPRRRKNLLRESHGMAPSKTERGTGMPVPLISEPIRVRRATGCRQTSYDPPCYWA